MLSASPLLLVTHLHPQMSLFAAGSFMRASSLNTFTKNSIWGMLHATLNTTLTKHCRCVPLCLAWCNSPLYMKTRNRCVYLLPSLPITTAWDLLLSSLPKAVLVLLVISNAAAVSGLTCFCCWGEYVISASEQSQLGFNNGTSDMSLVTVQALRDAKVWISQTKHTGPQCVHCRGRSCKAVPTTSLPKGCCHCKGHITDFMGEGSSSPS